MNRRRFLKTSTAVLLATPNILSAAPASRVLIIGSGSAGLTAGYHLKQAGVDVQILEAASHWGGRIARLNGFADFPIDLGAEWIHDDPEILGRIIGRGDSDLGVETIDYRPQTYQVWHKGKLRNRNMLRHAYAEVKFRTTTWYGFFEKFILPSVRHNISLNAEVTNITHDRSGVTVTLRDGRQFAGDQVLVTVPVSVLKRSAIRFTPNLPDRIAEGLRGVPFGRGFKLFMKFRERFYPDILLTGAISQMLADDWDDKTYYDAAFGKPSKDNILGLFTVAEGRLDRSGLSDKALVADVLFELDQIYDSRPSRLLQDVHVQNWTQKPHIRGSYSMEISSDQPPEEFLSPIDGKVHFAGELLGGNAQATVHGAAFSAIRAVKNILRG